MPWVLPPVVTNRVTLPSGAMRLTKSARQFATYRFPARSKTGPSGIARPFAYLTPKDRPGRALHLSRGNGTSTPRYAEILAASITSTHRKPSHAVSTGHSPYRIHRAKLLNSAL